jgi:anti-sigma-K factor RskA
MAMKSKYPNADELCLKYVLDELDPSEVLVVEKMMTEDENVLIDVESMRRTLSRLDQMPRVNPPEHVQRRILEMAAEHARNGHATIPIFSLQNRVLSWAAAAVVVFGLGFAVYNIALDAPADPAVASEQGQVALEQNTPAELQARDDGATPWVDRNEVLRLNQASAGEGMEDGLQNLRPVEQTTQPISPFREIQLTRVQRK